MKHWTLPAAFLVIVLAGCGRDASHTATTPLTSPAVTSSTDAATASLFQPLSIGDRWTYDRVVQIRTIPPSGPPGPALVLRAVIEREVVGEADVAGVTYRIVEERTYDEGDPVPWIQRVYWRQDRSGLYFIDVPPAGALHTLASPAPANGGIRLPETMSGTTRRAVDALLVRREAFLGSIGAGRPAATTALRSTDPGSDGAPTEYPFLVYPMHVGSTWVERPAGDPFEFKRTVVGREALDLPTGRTSAWQVRHELEAFGPNDHATFWYDRNGSPGYVFHAEIVNTDANGTPLETDSWDERVTLTSFELIESGR